MGKQSIKELGEEIDDLVRKGIPISFKKVVTFIEGQYKLEQKKLTLYYTLINKIKVIIIKIKNFVCSF